MGKKLHLVVCIALLLFLTSILLFEAWSDAGTYDEVGHITAGYTYVYLRDFRLYPDNPPFIKMLSVLPWWPIRNSIKFPSSAPEYTQTDHIDQWRLGTKFLYQSGNSADLLIFLARIPVIIATILLGLLVSQIAADFYGKKAGVFALFLYVLEPSIRAHGHLVTTDVGATFFALFGLYLLYRHFIKAPKSLAGSMSWMMPITVAGFFFGLALLSKYSMLFFIPIIFLILIIFIFLRRHSPYYLLPATYFLLASYATLWLVSTVIDYTNVTFRYDEVGLNKSAVEQLSNHPTWKLFHLVPWPYYYQVGLETMYARNTVGQPSFLFGQVNPNGNWWHYFLITYLVKTPMPILIFLVLASIVTIKLKMQNAKLKITNQNLKLSLLPTTYYLLPLITGLLFFAIVSGSGNLSIGLRFVFPSIVLFLIFASSVVSNFKATRRNILIGSILCLWLIATNIFSLPYDLSYVNEIGGGTWNGYKTVEDSSYDWGQDLKRLGTWYSAWVARGRGPDSAELEASIDGRGTRDRTHESKEITLSYLGTADPAYYGIKYKPLRFEDLNNLKGIVAISSTNLMLGGRYLKDQSGKETYDPSPLAIFYRKTPIARAGTTMFIYRFP